MPANKALASTKERAALVRPSAAQRAWQEMEITTFTHWGMPTFYDEQDWGLGTEEPAFFNPTGFDPDQWVETAKLTDRKSTRLNSSHYS